MKYITIAILLFAAIATAQKHPHKIKRNLRDSAFIADSIRQENEATVWLDSFDRARDSSLWTRAKLTKGSHVVCEQFGEKGTPLSFQGIAIGCEDKGFDWGTWFTDEGLVSKYGRYVLYCTVQIDSFRTLTKEFPACNCYLK